MTKDKSDRPNIDSPEFEKWLRSRTAKYRREEIGNSDSGFDERELASGDYDDIHKTDAELFPDEVEEHTPEERRKKFKVHSKNSKDKEKPA